MKKQELLKQFDDDLLDKLFGFCYARTNDSYEAQELCSDIIFALVKAAHTDGEITNIYSFIWRVARNVYADFSSNHRRYADTFYDGDADEILQFIPDEEQKDDSDELLNSVYRRIAFLTKAYREVMIMYYIDGLSTAEIAKQQNTSEGAVRQRLFSARQKIKSEVEEMAETYNRPVALDEIDYVIWGTGSPAWGDPRNVCTRIFSNHIVWLCHKKPMSASEIAEELNVPTVYVEEELEILRKGENGEYGFLRRLDNGKYAINFILLDKDVIEKANALYTEQLPKICDIISNYIEEHKAEYLAFPYLNKKVDMNLILWQQVSNISRAFSENVERILKEKYFSDVADVKRPFSVFGYVDNGKYYGGGFLVQLVCNSLLSVALQVHGEDSSDDYCFCFVDDQAAVDKIEAVCRSTAVEIAGLHPLFVAPTHIPRYRLALLLGGHTGECYDHLTIQFIGIDALFFEVDADADVFKEADR